MMETKLEYMQRRLEAYRKITPEYREVKPEMIVPLQRDFPNCENKYSKCCRIDKPFWDELEAKLKEIEYRKQPFRLKDVDLTESTWSNSGRKPPKGFEENIELSKHVDWEEKEKHGV